MRPRRQVRRVQPTSAQITLKFFVEMVSLVAATSFIGAVVLGVEVFKHWDLNFLQIASPADIVGTGISVFVQIFVPVLCMLVAGLVASVFEFRWARWEIIVGLVSIGLSLALATGLEWMAVRQMEAWYRDLGQAGGGPTSGLAAYMVLRNAGGVVAIAAQSLLVFAVVRIARHLLGQRDSDPRKNTLRVGISGMLAISLCYLPWLVLQTRAEAIATEGFLHGMLAPYGCEPGDDLVGAQHSELLWVGERGAVVKCQYSSDVRIIFGPLQDFMAAPWADPVLLDPSVPAADADPEAGFQSDDGGS